MRIAAFLLCFGAVAWSATPEIVRPAIERSEDGAPVFAPDTFLGGETVHFSFFVERYTRVGNAVHLSFQAQSADDAEKSLAPAMTDDQTYTLAPQDRDWVPKFRGSFNLPMVLGAGNYHVTIRVTDEFTHQSVSRAVPFLVGGAPVEASPSLAIRNLAFYRNDEDARPLAVPAFRLNEEVHARFQIVGYRYSGDGSDDVSYGISVADSSGRVLFGEANAAEDKSTEFYPKPYVPGILNFSVTPGTPAGDYVLTVTARDAIGNQTAETHRSFRLE